MYTNYSKTIFNGASCKVDDNHHHIPIPLHQKWSETDRHLKSSIWYAHTYRDWLKGYGFYHVYLINLLGICMPMHLVTNSSLYLIYIWLKLIFGYDLSKVSIDSRNGFNVDKPFFKSMLSKTFHDRISVKMC